MLLPAATFVLTAIHVYLVRKHGATPSPGDIAPKRHFYPGQVFKDIVAVFLAFTFLLIAALLFDAPLEQMADPTDSSYVPRPEWYFLFLFQSLKLFHGSLESFASVGLPFLAVLCLALLPFVDRSFMTTWRNRAWAGAACVAAFACWSTLTYAAYRTSPHQPALEAAQPALQRLLSLPPDELAGFSYFRQANCRQCHNLLEGEPTVGPTLATLPNRRAPEWAEGHIHENLEASNPPRKLSSAQVNALVQFVAKIRPENAVELEQAPADLLAGADVFVRNLCTSCHKINGVGGQTGPQLNGLQTRRSREWVERHFLAPNVISPGTIMPPYHFSPEERDQIVSYLFRLQ
jgi:ubiquinol-cytochrome c reductase cytochrome b subunit